MRGEPGRVKERSCDHQDHVKTMTLRPAERPEREIAEHANTAAVAQSPIAGIACMPTTDATACMPDSNYGLSADAAEGIG